MHRSSSDVSSEFTIDTRYNSVFSFVAPFAIERGTQCTGYTLNVHSTTDLSKHQHQPEGMLSARFQCRLVEMHAVCSTNV